MRLLAVTMSTSVRSAGAAWLDSASTQAASTTMGDEALHSEPSTDPFGMTPWRDSAATAAGAEDTRRRTPSFVAAVANKVNPPGDGVSVPARQPQRRETFHAGQFSTFNPQSSQGQVDATGSLRRNPAHKSAADRRQSTPDPFGHTPFVVTDGPSDPPPYEIDESEPRYTAAPSAGQSSARSGAAAGGLGAANSSANLQHPDEVLLFQQAQLKKQEEQLQIHISTLRRKELELQREHRALAHQQQQLSQEEQQHQHQQHIPVASSMPASTDMFGMTEFAPDQPAASYHPINSVPPKSVLGKDEFGMDRFTPSSSVPAQSNIRQPYQPNEDTTDGGVISTQHGQQHQPTNRSGPTRQQNPNQRLAQASSELPRLSTAGSLGPDEQRNGM